MTPIPLRTRLSLDLMRLYRGVQTRLHDLTYLFWECTLRCNLSCLHCGSDCTADAATPDMPLADFLRVVDQIRPHVNPHKVTIALTGGEPLMRPDLAECGRALYERGFPWGMVTNGFALNAARLNSLLVAGLRSLTISLDGLADSHDWLRGKRGSFDRALEAVKLAASTAGLVFDVVTCVNQRNYAELDAVENLLVGLGVKRWRLFTIFAKGRAGGNPQLRVSAEQFQGLMEFISQTAAAGSIRASYGCEGFLGRYEGRARANLFFCRAGINVASVLADGSISACPSLRGDYIQGNIRSDAFMDVWNNRFGVMRDRAWAATGECAACGVWKWCQGNGLHLREEKSGALLMCHYRLLEQARAPV